MAGNLLFLKVDEGLESIEINIENDSFDEMLMTSHSNVKKRMKRIQFSKNNILISLYQLRGIMSKFIHRMIQIKFSLNYSYVEFYRSLTLK